MKRINRLLLAGIVAVTLAPLAGCDRLLLENAATGLREGTLTAVGGIIEDFFNLKFGLEESEGGEDEEEAGDDLFARI